MTERRSFYRKLGYLGGIVVLLFPLAMLGAPATRNAAGGKLAQLRVQHGLAQASIGKIDPASETIKLATLGLRGVAVNLLWNKANEYKKKENWTKLAATLDQLAKLQPNFISFWKFQAWNVTYNVSVEFDDYHDRYYYVIRGINFLKEGTLYNQDNPKLLWDLGWFIGQKIGRADEHVEYRRLFKSDEDYHPPDRPRERRDNWLVGKEWYDRAIDAVDNKGRSLGKKSPVVFFDSPAMSLMNYADAIESEGIFGERARIAWRNAAKAWEEFGRHIVRHSTGVILRLGEAERLEESLKQLTAELEAIRPETRAELEAERKAELSEEERAALDTSQSERTSDQHLLAGEASKTLRVTAGDIAKRIAERKPDQETKALQLQREIDVVALRLRYTKNYRQTANYEYWRMRADFEQTNDALDARKLIFQAQQRNKELKIPEAEEKFREGFARWRAVLDAFPDLAEDSTAGEDLVEAIKEYRALLRQDGKTLGDDFPLWDILEEHDTGDFQEELEQRNASRAKPADEGPATESDESDEIVESSETENDE